MTPVLFIFLYDLVLIFPPTNKKNKKLLRMREGENKQKKKSG